MKKFLTIFFGILFSLLINATTTLAENIKFIQMTDVHFSANSQQSVKLLQSAVKDINNLQGVSFVVFTGDNIDRANEYDLRQFLKIIKDLKAPYYIVLGNHDVYKSGGLSKVKYFEIVNENKFLYPQKKSNYVFQKNGFVFLIVDGAKEVIPGPGGKYSEDTLAWVDKTLTKYNDKPAIIFQHFPIEYPDSSPGRIRTHKTYKDEDYKTIVAKHKNILAMISGHFHVNWENMKDGVYYISTPSFQQLPQSYKIIDIVTTKEFSPIIYTQLREIEVKE